VPLSQRMRELLSLSAFAAPTLRASGRPRPGSVSILDAVKAQQQEAARARSHESGSLAREIRRRVIERVSEAPTGPSGLMERIRLDAGDDEPGQSTGMLALMLRELRPRLE